MPHDDHDNIFDKDDALDFMMYEECEKGIRNRQGGNGGRGGCLGCLLLLAAPVGLFVTFCQIFFKS
jgi:hypothetical protein